MITMISREMVTPSQMGQRHFEVITSVFHQQRA